MGAYWALPLIQLLNWSYIYHCRGSRVHSQIALAELFARTDHPAIGIMERGGMVAPLKMDADNWGRASVFGKIDKTGTLRFLEDIDLDELDDQVAVSLRAHTTLT